MKAPRFLALLCVVTLTACGPVATRPASPPTATVDLRVGVTFGPRARATETAPAPQPLPPPTPLPSATPTVYIVQAGDTLLAIAYKYAITVEELQAANGNVQPQFLQIGQALLIPRPGAESGPAGDGSALLLPTPTPQSMPLAGLTLHETPAGSLWIMGEVYNPTGNYVTHVQLLVVLVGPNGERLGELIVFPALDLVAPQGRVPFGALFPARPQGMVNYHVELLSAETYAHDGPFVGGLRVAEDRGGPAGGLYRVTGALENPGAAAVNTAVVVTLYDEAGQVTGFQRESAGMLQPGARGPFDVRITPAGAGTTRYTIAVEGIKP